MNFRATLTLAVPAALLTLLLHIILFYTAEGYSGQSIIFEVSIILMVILLSIAGIRTARQMSTSLLSFGMEWKRVMQLISMYALLAGLSQIVYFNTVDKHYFDNKIAAGLESAAQVDLTQLPDDNPAKNMDRDTFIKKQEETLRGVYSNNFVVPATILAILIVGALYSVFTVLLFRKVPSLNRLFYRL